VRSIGAKQYGSYSFAATHHALESQCLVGTGFFTYRVICLVYILLDYLILRLFDFFDLTQVLFILVFVPVLIKS